MLFDDTDVYCNRTNNILNLVWMKQKQHVQKLHTTLFWKPKVTSTVRTKL